MMGRILTPPYYIPRKQIAAKLREHIFSEGAISGNVAIVGPPRSGKSTFVYNEINLRADELWSIRKVPIWICLDGNVHTDDDGTEFFRTLVFKTWQCLEDRDAVDGKLERQLGRVRQSGLSWTDVRNESERFFELVRRKDLSIVALFDEFDAMRKLFSSNPASLRSFRELCYSPQYGFSCVCTSRRFLRDIEAQAHGDQSTLAAIFHEFALPLYSDEEMEDFWGRFKGELSCETKEDLLLYCGKYPFLLDAYGKQIWEELRCGQAVDMEVCKARAEGDFRNCFEAIINVLDESGLYEKMVEAVLGPVVSLSNQDLSSLRRFSLLEVAPPSQKLAVFASSFENYLLHKTRERDTQEKLWPEYTNMVKVMRRAFLSVFGTTDRAWDERIEEYGREKAVDVLAECKRKKGQEEKSFPALRNVPLIEYLDLPELSAIVNVFWDDHFRICFEGHNINKKKWNSFVQAVIHIRNPLVHLREEVGGQGDKDIATAYCLKVGEIFSSMLD